jgi:hypothetical protein
VDEVTDDERVAVSEQPARQPPPATRPRRAAVVRFAVPPVVTYLAGHLLYLVAAARTGTRYLTASAHERWDSALYLQIADRGYHMFVCNEDPHLAFYGTAWCGNAGWFPLYPWLIRAVHALTGWTDGTCAVLVTEAATLTAVLLFWWLLVRVAEPVAPDGWGVGLRGTGLRNAALLALVAVFPVGVYLHAVFPMSLTLAATLACLGLAVRQRPVAAGLAGAAAAAAYPLGIAAGLAAVVVMVTAGRQGRHLAAAAVTAALSLAGLGLVFVTQQLTTGHWDAFFLSQDKYGGQRHDPVSAFVAMVTQPQGPPIGPPTSAALNHRLDVSVRAEMWVSLGLLLAGCAVVAAEALRRRYRPLDAGLLVFTAVTFVVPLFAGTQISQYRSHTLLLPGLLLLRRLPAAVLWALVLPAVVLAYRMGTLFYLKLLF